MVLWVVLCLVVGLMTIGSQSGGKALLVEYVELHKVDLGKHVVALRVRRRLLLLLGLRDHLPALRLRHRKVVLVFIYF